MTETLEAKRAQQLAGLAHEPLFQVLLNVRKVYDLLDSGRCLEILRGYGLVPNLARLLGNYWGMHIIVPMSGKFLGRPFGTRWGHRWELPGNYPVFNVVMVIYHYVERIWRILVAPVFLNNIYDH